MTLLQSTTEQTNWASLGIARRQYLKAPQNKQTGPRSGSRDGNASKHNRKTNLASLGIVRVLAGLNRERAVRKAYTIIEARMAYRMIV
jgi:hypothetical protein